MNAVAARGNDVVAVGVALGKGAVAWHSPDGFAWERAELAGSQRAAAYDVIATDGSYVAVGADGDRAAAWTSADGRSWSVAEVAGGETVTLRHLTRFGGGLVAIGGRENAGTEDVGIWRSTDGSHWDVLSERLALGQAMLNSIASGPAGLVVGGSLFYDAWTAEAWTSADGLTWEQVGLASAAGGFINDVAAVGPGFVAVGGRQDANFVFGPAIWVSADGSTWQVAADVPGGTSDRDVYLNAVAAGGRGTVAIGPNDHGTVGVWASTDGSDWILISGVGGLESPVETYGTYEPRDLVAGGPGLVSVGSYGNEDAGHTWSAAVWTNPAAAGGAVGSPPPIGCPSGVLALLDVIEIPDDERLDCFRAQHLTFRAYLAPTDGGEFPAGEPRWLIGRPVFLEVVPGGAHMAAQLSPEVDPTGELAYQAGPYIITGQFDEPRAQTCPPDLVEYCRHKFVVLEAVPVD